jgi:CelD/BcsL family acetyltransferase involved in cellulose biosynthesis
MRFSCSKNRICYEPNPNHELEQQQGELMHSSGKGNKKTVQRKGWGDKRYGKIVQAGSLESIQIHRPADLRNYQKPWRNLANNAPMQSLEWFLPWVEHYLTHDDELCTLVFRDSVGSEVGLAPLYIQRAKGKATIRLLGSGDACTNHTSWLTAPGWENQVGLEVARFLLDHTSEWDCLSLESIDDNDLAINTTVAYLKENGCFLRESPLPCCWKIALPPTWEDYLKMLSRKHRKQLRRMERKFFKSGLVRINKVRDEVGLQKGLNVLIQLHAKRWGEPAKPKGVFSDRKFRSFHEKVARKLLKQKQLRLAWLEHNSKPIAAEYQFVDETAVYAYQAGMDPSFGNLKPGNLSMMASIRYAIEQGCDSFDLLRGNESYKAHYRATPIACNDFLIWPDRLRGRLDYTMWYTRYYARIGRHLATQWLRKSGKDGK